MWQAKTSKTVMSQSCQVAVHDDAHQAAHHNDPASSRTRDDTRNQLTAMFKKSRRYWRNPGEMGHWLKHTHAHYLFVNFPCPWCRIYSSNYMMHYMMHNIGSITIDTWYGCTMTSTNPRRRTSACCSCPANTTSDPMCFVFFYVSL